MPDSMRLVRIHLLLAISAVGMLSAETFTVDNVGDAATTCSNCCQEAVNFDCTLRQAVLLSNSTIGRDNIHFSEFVGGINLLVSGRGEQAAASGDLDLLDDVSITATHRVIINGFGMADRIFDVFPGVEVFIENLRLQRGRTFDSEDGAGIHNDQGLVSLHQVVIETCESDSSGGAIYSSGGSLIVVRSELRNNSSAALGSAVFAGYLGSEATIQKTTISGNTNTAVVNLGTMTIQGSTISGNTDLGTLNRPTAIFNGGDLTLEFSTLADNIGGGIDIVRTDGAGDSFTIEGSLISGGCQAGGSTTSLGGSLESPGNTCGLSEQLDLVAVLDAMLLPLADNGGSTPTHHPTLGSPAIDAPLATLLECSATDQRDLPTGVDGDFDGSASCDIGSVESQWLFADGFESGDTSTWS
jgi:hypothetical protein